MNDSWDQTSDRFKAMMIGKLLGDGCITKQKGRKPRFQFTHTHTDYDWTVYCQKLLSPFIPLNKPKFKKTIDPRLIKGYSLSYYVQSKTSDIISYLRNEWYHSNEKILPKKLISNYFNEVSLAWWYMDDGHFKQTKNIPKKIILSTESFTTEGNKWLINFLHQRYNLYFKIDKQNRIILYDQFQIYYFLHLVTPHLHHCMHRKFISASSLKQFSTSRRTTIYLSLSIKIHSPTNDINHALSKLKVIVKNYKLNLFYESKIECNQQETKSYQIIICRENLSNLEFLKRNTGLTYGQLTELCFRM